ncbi:MAG: hypothetical protein CMA10_04820 [Euryarchaeota archaeon]|nr:hypothetical protein [Euryarchaeota archaeon]|tara:strand:- start:153 stop:1199 length:1047 start_codon:yes stop_codon:yes gene_type:complete
MTLALAAMGLAAAGSVAYSVRTYLRQFKPLVIRDVRCSHKNKPKAGAKPFPAEYSKAVAQVAMAAMQATPLAYDYYHAPADTRGDLPSLRRRLAKTLGAYLRKHVDPKGRVTNLDVAFSVNRANTCAVMATVSCSAGGGVVVCLPATRDNRNWATNLRMAPRDAQMWLGKGAVGSVHSGIVLAYRSVRQRIYKYLKCNASPRLPVLVCGHSLGGGLATLAAYDITRVGYSAVGYSIGPPRIGNAAMVDDFNKKVHGYHWFTTEGDPITRTGPRHLGYRHVKGGIIVNVENAEKNTCPAKPRYSPCRTFTDHPRARGPMGRDPRVCQRQHTRATYEMVITGCDDPSRQY